MIVLTEEKLNCVWDCALFTLPAEDSCHGRVIPWIKWLQMLGGKPGKQSH